MASGHLLGQFIDRPDLTAAQLGLINPINFAPGSLIYVQGNDETPSLFIVVQAANGTKSFKAIAIT